MRRDDAISHTASNLFVVHSVLHIMEVTGSGSNPSLLPLDIPYAKAVDWLVERRIVAKGSYQKALRTAHAKLEAALEAERPPVKAAAECLPADRTQQGTTYFDCVRVLEALKAEPGFDEKSFLGAYTNPHTARWADVVKRFESGSVFLVDTAQYLVHQCTYELPALKQELSRAERELQELQRRQSEYVRLAEASHSRFVQACTQKRISPAVETASGLKDELRASLCQLRPLYDAVARRVQQSPLPEAVGEYRELVGFALERVEPAPTAFESEAGGGGKAGKKGKAGGTKAAAKAEVAVAASVSAAAQTGASAGESAPLLPLLSRVQEIDLSEVAPLAALSTGDGSSGVGEGAGGAAIDWGITAGSDGGDASGGGGGVDWGITVEDDAAGVGGGAAAVEVDWGGGGGGGGVDWGITADDGGDSSGGAGGGGGGGGGEYDFGFEIEIEASGEAGASEDDAGLAQIFEESSLRNQLLDDLFELQAFLTQYLSELSGGASASALPNALQLDSAEVQSRLDAVTGAIESLDNEHTRHLLMLGSSEKYLERQVANLRQMLDSAEKMRRRAEELQTRQAELQMTIKGAAPKYQNAVNEIKRAKADLEAALAKHFDGRRVNLMGDINSL